MQTDSQAGGYANKKINIGRRMCQCSVTKQENRQFEDVTVERYASRKTHQEEILYARTKSEHLRICKQEAV
jgi:hypothetical protein